MFDYDYTVLLCIYIKIYFENTNSVDTVNKAVILYI